MANDPSCLVTKLSSYVELIDTDKEKLAALERSERNFGAGQDIYQGGSENKELFMVKHGLLLSYTDLPDGRRQIVTIHHPGDIVGFPDIALKQMTTTLCRVEDACLCPFPKSSLDMILREAPRLSALLLSIALRNQIVFIDLLRAMGRMSAKGKISYMLLNLIARLRITNHCMTDTLRLPMNQSQVVDYLGLTNVYASKPFIEMEKDGFIQRHVRNLQIRKGYEMIKLTDFHDRHAELDTSWFP